MGLDNIEQSPESGHPIALFHFVYGNGATDYFAYTDHDEDFTFKGITYEPVPIGRDKISSSGGLDNSTFTVEISPDAPIVKFMTTQTLNQEIKLIIRQGHIGDPDREFLIIWKGRITGAQKKRRTVQLGGESIVTSLRRPGLKRQYQRSCGWALYEPFCNAPRVVRASLVPRLVGGNLVILSSGWSSPLAPVKFKGGHVTWPSGVVGGLNIRTILDVRLHAQGDMLLFQGDTLGLGTGPIKVYAGCNHQPDDCRAVHDNIVNFGGQWNIPTENPVGFSNRYY